VTSVMYHQVEIPASGQRSKVVSLGQKMTWATGN
jgi:hypothetical protein